MDRVQRWLSTISLVLLALDAAWALSALPRFATLHFVAGWGPAYLLGHLLLPPTAAAVCEVAGAATLVVSVQRKQWGWVIGAVLCLVVHYFGGLALSFPAAVKLLYTLASGAYLVGIYLTLYSILGLAPMAVLAAVYAWTRRQPASDAATSHA
jgi:hypothetical protein